MFKGWWGQNILVEILCLTLSGCFYFSLGFRFLGRTKPSLDFDLDCFPQWMKQIWKGHKDFLDDNALYIFHLIQHQVFAKGSPWIFQPVLCESLLPIQALPDLPSQKVYINLLWSFHFYAVFHIILVSAEAIKQHMLFLSANKRSLFVSYCLILSPALMPLSSISCKSYLSHADHLACPPTLSQSYSYHLSLKCLVHG